MLARSECDMPGRSAGANEENISRSARPFLARNQRSLESSLKMINVVRFSVIGSHRCARLKVFTRRDAVPHVQSQEIARNG